MKLFFDETQLAHQPRQYMVHGRIVDPFENPNRAPTLIAALERAGLERAKPADFGRAPILAAHADHYVAFLEEAYARFMELPNHGLRCCRMCIPIAARRRPMPIVAGRA
jgi:acetoin utilization deacetylase AcuC-like enzyme